MIVVHEPATEHGVEWWHIYPFTDYPGPMSPVIDVGKRARDGEMSVVLDFTYVPEVMSAEQFDQYMAGLITARDIMAGQMALAVPVARADADDGGEQGTGTTSEADDGH